MIVSYKLLQTYFDKKLPRPDVIAEALTFHAFEIESMEKRGSDTIIDVKILPNRAHDCLSHRGVAREIGAILDIPLKKVPVAKCPKSHAKTPSVVVEVKDKRVLRYMSLVLEGVKVGPSPKWLRVALESIGQRSINNVVDATNYVMFMVGQPLHAFDLDKVEGKNIMVRGAKAGETLTTLDGKEVTLEEGVLVIADKDGVLGIAGIKGGTKAEVTTETNTIVLEAANFDASTIRLAAQRLNIRTDASKRFESGFTPYLAEEALVTVATIIVQVAGGKNVHVGKVVDKFGKKPKAHTVAISHTDINGILGTALSEKEVVAVWRKLGFEYTVKKVKDSVVYTIIPPHERMDITIKQDLAEEVGRMVGYDVLLPVMPEEEVLSPRENAHWRVADVVRNIMMNSGFSEVYTYTFLGTGEIEVANPIAKDKRFLRNNLMNGLKDAVLENLKHESEVRIFELGHIFGKSAHRICEEHSFAALTGFTKRKESQMKEDFYVLKGVLDTLWEALGISDIEYKDADGELVASVYAKDALIGTMTINGFEFDFGRMVQLSSSKSIRYQLPSRFPSIIRDVSLFVPNKTKAGEVREVILENAGVLMQSLSLFDIFEQPEKKSLAFRMILQSTERTLSDDEANDIYNNVVSALRAKDGAWEVRA